MKKINHALFTLFTVLAAGVASAQSINNDSSYYGEIGFTPISIKGDGVTFKPKLARFTIGKDIHENLSVEGMYGVTFSKDNYQGVEVSANAYGVFLKPKVEFAKDTELFARLGWVHSEIKATGNGGADSSSGSDASYGLGIQTKFTKDFYGQFDYMNYYNKNGITSKGLTVSVGSRF